MSVARTVFPKDDAEHLSFQNELLIETSEKSAKAVSASIEGHECGRVESSQYCAGMPQISDQRNL